MVSSDIAIVGAGPIGLEMAAALKRAGFDYLHFDARQIGYTISWFAPGTKFFSSNERIAIAGVPLHTADQTKATREEYLNYLRTVVELYDLKINTYEPVVGIERADEGFMLRTRTNAGPKSYHVNKLILCTGGTDHPRRLNVPGEDLAHVSHYFQDPHIYFRRKLLIVGGKNSAVEAALRAYHAGAEVSLSYRRAQLEPKSIKYWLLPEINNLIDTGKMPAYFNTVVTGITPTNVLLREGSGFGVQGSGEDKDAGPASSYSSLKPEPGTLNPRADFVLLLTGYEQDNALLRMAGVELRDECLSPVFDERTMETNVPGVYVAGTAVAGTQSKYRVFIENCHVHVARILAALSGSAAPELVVPAETVALPES